MFQYSGTLQVVCRFLHLDKVGYRQLVHIVLQSSHWDMCTHLEQYTVLHFDMAECKQLQNAIKWIYDSFHCDVLICTLQSHITAKTEQLWPIVARTAW